MQTAEEMLQNPYRKYVDKYLKTKGLRKTMATLNRLIRGPLRRYVELSTIVRKNIASCFVPVIVLHSPSIFYLRAKLALEKPAGLEVKVKSGADEPNAPTGDGVSKSGDASVPTAVRVEQPFHYHPHLQGKV